MPAELTPAVSVFARASLTAEDSTTCRLTLRLMLELEASLHAGRKPLLALDLDGIERETGEQVRLMCQLDAVLKRSQAARACGNQPSKMLELCQADHCEPERDLRLCCHRILEAARLQAALLVRLRWKLRVLANMLAGRSVTYRPPAARNEELSPVFGWKPGGE